VTVEITGVLVAAFGAGLVDAMACGGGLIQMPALFAAFPGTPHTTLLGTGKLAGLAGTSSAIFRFIRHVRLDGRLVGAASAGAFCAAFLGARIATRVPPAQFRALVPLLLAVVLAYTVVHKNLGQVHEPKGGLALAAGTAGVVGLYDGFFGPGTGSFLVFLFIRVFGLDFLHASASAKVVNAAANVAALLYFGFTAKLMWLLGLGMAACNVAGAQVGSHLAIRGGSAFVRKVFLAVVTCLIAKTAWDAQLPHLW
jgi:uncharacterized membrane protein YfcA